MYRFVVSETYFKFDKKRCIDSRGDSWRAFKDCRVHISPFNKIRRRRRAPSEGESSRRFERREQQRERKRRRTRTCIRISQREVFRVVVPALMSFPANEISAVPRIRPNRVAVRRLRRRPRRSIFARRPSCVGIT